MPQMTAPQGYDPFMAAMQEEKKLQYVQMQKAQATKLAQQTAAQQNGENTGVTPNMFFQQMMNMMASQGGGNNQQNAAMLAQMQLMMQQMSMNTQDEAPKKDVQQEASFTPPPDTSNGAFKSLFNNAADTATGSRKSDSGFPSSSSNSFNSFSSPTVNNPEPFRASEPANPFSTFETPSQASPSQAAPTDASGFGSGEFSNSGWSGGTPTQSQPAAPSNNPFDMFK
jgi:hypothetical protein